MVKVSHNLMLNLIQFADLLDAFIIMLKSHLVIQLIIQFHHLELIQIFKEHLTVLM